MARSGQFVSLIGENMNFEEILNQWEQQTQRPYGKKRLRRDAKNPTAAAPAPIVTNSKNSFLDQRISRLKVSGGYNSEEASIVLETPSYIRNQMD